MFGSLENLIRDARGAPKGPVYGHVENSKVTLGWDRTSQYYNCYLKLRVGDGKATNVFVSKKGEVSWGACERVMYEFLRASVKEYEQRNPSHCAYPNASVYSLKGSDFSKEGIYKDMKGLFPLSLCLTEDKAQKAMTPVFVKGDGSNCSELITFLYSQNIQFKRSLFEK